MLRYFYCIWYFFGFSQAEHMYAYSGHDCHIPCIMSKELNEPRGWWNMEFTYTVAKEIKAPVLNPPKSGMFFPPSYVFLRRNHQLLAAVTSEYPLPLTVTINNDGGFGVMVLHVVGFVKLKFTITQ